MTVVKPMLCKAASAVPTDPNMRMEPKFNGWRCKAHITDHSVDLYSRTGNPITQVIYIAERLVDLPAGTILDGELVSLACGQEAFKRTQSICKKQQLHKPTAADPPLVYRVFDILEVGGDSAMSEPLTTRRKLLEMAMRLVDEDPALAALAGGKLVEAVEQIACDDSRAEEFFTTLIEEGAEGVVCKRDDSIYVPGARNGSWIKVKPEEEMDVEVTGTYPTKAGSKYEGRAVGGITFRTPEGYEGRAAGMSDELREQLFHDDSPFIGLVAEVAFAGVQESGALLFPRFKTFRDPADKSADELAEEPAGGSSASAAFLLDKCLDLEERNRELETENSELRIRLNAFAANLGEDPVPARKPRKAPTPNVEAAPAVARSGGTIKMRNYKAMGAPKLIAAVQDLRRGAGEHFQDALDREQKGGPTVGESLRDAEHWARQKNLSI